MVRGRVAANLQKLLQRMNHRDSQKKNFVITITKFFFSKQGD